VELVVARAQQVDADLTPAAPPFSSVIVPFP